MKLPSFAKAWHMVCTATRGCEKFAAAIVAGDYASSRDVEARSRVCKMCDAYTVTRLPGMQSESAWCGEPLIETETTCGCALYGKVRVGSERCPRGKWGAVGLTVKGVPRE